MCLRRAAPLFSSPSLPLSIVMRSTRTLPTHAERERERVSEADRTALRNSGQADGRLSAPTPTKTMKKKSESAASRGHTHQSEKSKKIQKRNKKKKKAAQGGLEKKSAIKTEEKQKGNVF